ncbi:MAG: hypothetical protein KKC03_06980 [Bacteroidetes bacterium]|nr:hypothetical protein [Bacteroidota bacterium]
MITFFCCTSVLAQQLTLSIIGSNPLETKSIDSVGYQKQFDAFSDLQFEKNRLLKQLNQYGFIQAIEQAARSQGDTLYIYSFFLGKRYTKLRVHYNNELLPQTFLKKLSDKITDLHFEIPIENTEKTLEQISEYYESQGFTFTKVQLSNIREFENTLLADLNTQTQAQRTLDQIVIRGYETFPTNFLRYFAGLKTGQKLSKDDIIARSEILAGLPFVKQNKPPEILFRADSTIVYLYLDKVKNNTFDGFLGFSNDEDTGDFTLNGTIDFRLNNTLNRGETLNLFWKDDGEGQTRFSTEVDIPYFFNAPLGVNASLFIYRQDSTFVNVDTKFNLTYRFNDRLQVAAGIKQYTSDNLLDIPLATVADLDANFFNAEGLYEIRQSDNLFFPRKLSLRLLAETGNRKNNGETTAQQRFGFRGLYQMSLNERNKILLRNTTETLLSPNFFENETFRFGGINSIRGFSENALIATTYAVVNTEYQYVLSNVLYLHTITDFAYLENEITEVTDNLISFGFGFGLQTRAGVLRLNYAVGKSKSSDFTLNDSKIHISLNAVF